MSNCMDDDHLNVFAFVAMRSFARIETRRAREAEQQVSISSGIKSSVAWICNPGGFGILVSTIRFQVNNSDLCGILLNGPAARRPCKV